MARKREPVAELGAEDYRIVRHTHDIELAEMLMRAELARENGYPEWLDPAREPSVGKPRLAWIRIVPALPGTWAEAEGWSFEYQDARPHTRGAFPAVVFS